MVMILIVIFGFLVYFCIQPLIWWWNKKFLLKLCQWAGPEIVTNRNQQAAFFLLLRRLGFFPAGNLGRSKDTAEKNFQVFIAEIINDDVSTFVARAHKVGTQKRDD